MAILGAVAIAGCGGSEAAIAAPAEPTATFAARGGAAFTLVESRLDHGHTTPFFVKDDGGVVVGLSGLDPLEGLQAFRWTPGGGARAIDPPDVVPSPDRLGLFALAASRDMSTLVGAVVREKDQIAFRWSERDGVEPLPAVVAEAPLELKLQISGDGRVIVGQARGAAFRWTAQAGLTSLGTLPGDAASEALAVSDDGEVIVGQSFASASPGAGGGRPFRWTTRAGMAALDAPSGLDACRFLGQMSADGRVIFGACSSAGGLGNELVRWTEGDAEGITVPAPWPGVRPRGVTRDGSVLVGTLEVGPPLTAGDTLAATTLFRWTEASGVTPLRAGDPARGATWEGFDGVGAFVIGDVDLPSPRVGRAVLWNAGGQATILEPAAGFEVSAARSVSADGSIVTGVSQMSVTNGAVVTATLWDAARRPRVVSDLLSAAGADLQSARLVSAIVSRDGKTLTGAAFDAQGRPAAWIAPLR